MNAEAFWITGVRQAEIRNLTLPPATPTQVTVRSLYSAISRGTESLVFNGTVPPSEYQRMRAPFQEGDFPFPVKYGYINVGLVEAGPEHLLGKEVFCLYPHQSRYIVAADAVTPIPSNIPAARAVLCANLETAINALWDAQPNIGDRITVVGAGVVGCLVAWLAAAIPGCEVELVDINRHREPIAQELGVDFKLPAQASHERDLVIHASASEQGLQTALELAGFEATILELSWYGDKAVSIPLGQAFHSQRLQIRSSQVGQIAPAQRSRWDYQRRLALAMRLLEDATLDCLISGESDFRTLPETLGQLVSKGENVLCHRIRYHQT
ncbi:zinc-dependent alcohol dehydrogenase [Granulosicoccus antarcticus]|nr:zinc-binding alcohol dehydrogenase [Granulosicoccus antarcticus]